MTQSCLTFRFDTVLVIFNEVQINNTGVRGFQIVFRSHKSPLKQFTIDLSDTQTHTVAFDSEIDTLAKDLN